MKLTAKNVDEVLTDCMGDKSEITPQQAADAQMGNPPEGWIISEGVILKVLLNKARLEAHREDVRSMLSELPEPFFETHGGGWSFLNACMTRDDEQWGEHRNIDALLCLGIPLGLARIQFPRSFWSSFPGGMPYFCVSTV